MPTGQDLIAVAHQYLGLPYQSNPQWNPGDTPTSFDCSEFTEWVCLDGRLAGAPPRVVGRAVPAVPPGSPADLRRRRASHSRRAALRASVTASRDPSTRRPSGRASPRLVRASATGRRRSRRSGRTARAWRSRACGSATDAAGRTIPRFNFAALAPGVDYPGFNGHVGGGGGGGGGSMAAVGRRRRGVPPGTGRGHDKRILKQGLTGEDVREAQSMLIAVGAPSLAGRRPTPNFADLTIAAVGLVPAEGAGRAGRGHRHAGDPSGRAGHVGLALRVHGALSPAAPSRTATAVSGVAAGPIS